MPGGGGGALRMVRRIAMMATVFSIVALSGADSGQHYEAGGPNDNSPKQAVTSAPLSLSLPITLFPAPSIEPFAYPEAYPPPDEGQKSSNDEPVWRLGWLWIVA